ncbi:MAG: protein kinase [Eubacteriaceae bacterium]|nr:protein kinase [Eubacteriaceae bacterium]
MDENTIQSLWPELEIVEKIGQGIHSEVYKAVMRGTAGQNQYYAVKVLEIPKQATNPPSSSAYNAAQVMNSIIAELKTLKDIQSDYIAKPLDYSAQPREDGGWDIYLKLELLRSLEIYMGARGLSEREAIKLGQDISDALVHAHKNNLVHGEIKPQNIFVDPQGGFKLGDFSVSKNARIMDRLVSRPRRMIFAAPETYNSNASTQSSDIYCLGLVVYYSLNYCLLPFATTNIPGERELQELPIKRMTSEIPPPEGASGEIAQAVLKAINPMTVNRYMDALSFSKELQTALMEMLDPRNIGPRNEAIGGVIDGFFQRSAEMLSETKKSISRFGAMKRIDTPTYGNFSGKTGKINASEFEEENIQGVVETPEPAGHGAGFGLEDVPDGFGMFESISDIDLSEDTGSFNPFGSDLDDIDLPDTQGGYGNLEESGDINLPEASSNLSHFDDSAVDSSRLDADTNYNPFDAAGAVNFSDTTDGFYLSEQDEEPLIQQMPLAASSSFQQAASKGAFQSVPITGSYNGGTWGSPKDEIAEPPPRKTLSRSVPRKSQAQQNIYSDDGEDDLLLDPSPVPNAQSDLAGSGQNAFMGNAAFDEEEDEEEFDFTPARKRGRPERKESKFIKAGVIALVAILVISLPIMLFDVRGFVDSLFSKKAAEATEQTTNLPPDNSQQASSGDDEPTIENSHGEQNTNANEGNQSVDPPVQTVAQPTYEGANRHFVEFYESYIAALNASDANLLTGCNSTAKSSMQERFKYNTNSTYSLKTVELDPSRKKQDGQDFTMSYRCTTSYTSNGSSTPKSAVAVWDVKISYSSLDQKYTVVSASRRDNSEEIRISNPESIYPE